MSLNHLKNKRGGFKSQLSRIETFVSELTGSEEVYILKVKLKSISGHYDNYQKVQLEIVSLSNPDDDNYSSDDEAENVVADRFESCIAMLELLIENKQKESLNLNTRPNDVSNVVLPKINIKPFSGAASEWPSFIDLFTALVLNNNNLKSEGEKFYYLKGLLRGPPLEMIESLSVTNQNLNIALNILKKAYDDKYKLLYSLYQTLVDQKPVLKSTSVELREFQISTRKTFDLIKNMNLSPEVNFESLIIFLMEQKLDFNSRRAFESERKPELIPTAEYFFDFLQQRQSMLENLNLFETNTKGKFNPKSNNVCKNRVTLVSSLSSSQQYHSSSSRVNRPSCPHCSDPSHLIYGCSKFMSLSPQERYQIVKAKKLCVNCLNSTHSTTDCKSLRRCATCNKSHHSYLHFDSQNRLPTNSNNRNNPRASSSGSPNVTSLSNVNNHPSPINVHNNTSPDQINRSNFINTSSASSNQSPEPPESVRYQTALTAMSAKDSIVLLPTALVNVNGFNGRCLVGRVLLDSASQMSVINRAFVQKLNLVSRKQTLNISGLGSNNYTYSREVVDITFNSQIAPYSTFTISCSVIDKITNSLPQSSISPSNFKIPSHIKLELADPLFFESGPIDLLIGCDLYHYLLKGTVLKTDPYSPSFIDTHLGYVIAGPIPLRNANSSQHKPKSAYSFLTVYNDQVYQYSDLQRTMEKFWELEEIPECPSQDPSEEYVEQLFRDTTVILPSGRYQVDMPLLANQNKKLGQSFGIAIQRFSSLERKFNANPTLFSEYKKVISEYLTLNHAQVIPLSFYNTVSNDFKYFIPHRAVIREESASTKLRIVFDFSAKTNSGFSLNDLTSKGYQVQDNLFDILCRFRCYKYVLCADIKMMYRFIDINPMQRYLQNILWRDNPTKPLQCIQLSRLSFGQNCAPFLATRVLKDIALNSPDCPNAQQAILHQTYMDDILTGTNKEMDLPALYAELTNMLGKHEFQLHKWQSNSFKFLQSIDELPNAELDRSFDDSSSKILGLKWNPASDILHIQTAKLADCSHITKRRILSTVASTFDPLGLVNNLTVFGKLLMQSVWKSQIGWDVPISDTSIITQFNKFLSLLTEAAHLRVPRYLFNQKIITSCSLHGFCDASQKAYGGCLYLVAIYADNSRSSRLITAKSRVNPLKITLTIPKLELCAMELLSTLARRIAQILCISLHISSINLWSDSQVALSWVKRSSNDFSPFVARRVLTIQNNSKEFIWRHVKSDLNPADLLSRGKFSSDVWIFWFEGPRFLLESKDFDSMDSFEPIDDLPEVKKVNLAIVNSDLNFWEPIFFRFSKFITLNRVIAHIFKFINLSRRKFRDVGSLSVEDLRIAHDFIIKQIQHKHFFNEIRCLKTNVPIGNKDLIPLNIFLDNDGLLRVGGRLQFSTLPFNQKFPLLLPQNDHVVDLLIIREHRRLGHGGAQNVLGNLRLQYWPLNGTRLVKKLIKSCITCFRFNAQFASQIMSPLPLDRVQKSRPFSKTGIDFAGPVQIKSSRLRKAPIQKAYIAIFICMVTKAIHIELVSDLSTDAFIATLKRFLSRRGNPQTIYTDNGSNFVGARNQLRELSIFLKSSESINKIQSFLSTTEISWKFIPPRSPHWGGLWEAAVKSAKSHLTKIIGNSCLTFEELSTVLSQIEAILNSRPLYPMSNDPTDLSPLTPGHFLIGAPLTAYPDRDLSTIPVNRLTFWEQCTKMNQEFWKRWSTDYLHRLQHRPKWCKASNNLQLNQLVLVQSEDRPPLNWPLARVVELLTGKDGNVRAARVRTVDGVYIRPITKLAPLPCMD